LGIQRQARNFVQVGGFGDEAEASLRADETPEATCRGQREDRGGQTPWAEGREAHGVRGEHLEGENPKRGATEGTANSRSGGTHRRAEQDLEVERTSCGSRRPQRQRGEHGARNGREGLLLDERGWLRGGRNPWTEDRTLDVAAWMKQAREP
jgi:hypothetical protein